MVYFCAAVARAAQAVVNDERIAVNTLTKLTTNTKTNYSVEFPGSTTSVLLPVSKGK